jgi:hypothetical protein
MYEMIVDESGDLPHPQILYNPQRIIYFIYVPFVFKINKILVDHLPTVRKDHCFSAQVIPSFLFHLFITSYILFKKKISPKMQCEKLYNLQRTIYFIYTPFVFKISKSLCDQYMIFSQCRKLVT